MAYFAPIRRSPRVCAYGLKKGHPQRSHATPAVTGWLSAGIALKSDAEESYVKICFFLSGKRPDRVGSKPLCGLVLWQNLPFLNEHYCAGTSPGTNPSWIGTNLRMGTSFGQMKT
jgi:hypothetical protein